MLQKFKTNFKSNIAPKMAAQFLNAMSIYMYDISVAGRAEEVQKVILKSARMAVEKKMKYSLSKTKYMVAKLGKEKEEDILEQVKAGNIQRTKKNKYL